MAIVKANQSGTKFPGSVKKGGSITSKVPITPWGVETIPQHPDGYAPFPLELLATASSTMANHLREEVKDSATGQVIGTRLSFKRPDWAKTINWDLPDALLTTMFKSVYKQPGTYLIRLGHLLNSRQFEVNSLAQKPIQVNDLARIFFDKTLASDDTLAYVGSGKSSGFIREGVIVGFEGECIGGEAQDALITEHLRLGKVIILAGRHRTTAISTFLLNLRDTIAPTWQQLSNLLIPVYVRIYPQGYMAQIIKGLNTCRKQSAIEVKKGALMSTLHKTVGATVFDGLSIACGSMGEKTSDTVAGTAFTAYFDSLFVHDIEVAGTVRQVNEVINGIEITPESRPALLAPFLAIYRKKGVRVGIQPQEMAKLLEEYADTIRHIFEKYIPANYQIPIQRTYGRPIGLVALRLMGLKESLADTVKLGYSEQKVVADMFVAFKTTPPPELMTVQQLHEWSTRKEQTAREIDKQLQQSMSPEEWVQYKEERQAKAKKERDDKAAAAKQAKADALKAKQLAESEQAIAEVEVASTKLAATPVAPLKKPMTKVTQPVAQQATQPKKPGMKRKL